MTIDPKEGSRHFQETKETARAAIIHQARVEGNIVRSRIPIHTRATRRMNKVAESPDNAAALAAVYDFLEGVIVPPLLLIIGVPGVGKTTLAYAVAWEYLEDALTVQYWQAEELLTELQTNLEDGKEFARIWRGLKECDLLILDDLCAQNRTKWRDSQLDMIIDFRYRENAPLLMMANKVDMEERIIDRIKECRTAMITGKSWRGRNLA